MGKCDPFRVGKIAGSRSVGGGRKKRALAHGYSIDPLRGSAMAMAFSAASLARHMPPSRAALRAPMHAKRSTSEVTSAGVAQLVECNLSKVEITGSSPVSRSNSPPNLRAVISEKRRTL